MTELPFLTDEDRKELQQGLKAMPASVSQAFVAIAREFGRDLGRDYRAGNLQRFMLRGQDFQEVDLRGADLRGADLAGAHHFDPEQVLMEGAYLGEGRWAPADPPGRWHLRWQIMREDGKSATLLKEVPQVLEAVQGSWTPEEIAFSREFIASAEAPEAAAPEMQPPLYDEIPERVPHPTGMFGFNRRWGRLSD